MEFSRTFNERKADLMEWSFAWRTLYKLLEARIFSTLPLWIILIPWAQHATEGFPNSVNLSQFGFDPPLPVDLSLPFSLKCLYYSAIAMFAARLIYSWRCPTFLRSFQSAGHAASEGVTVQYIVSEARDFLGLYYKRRRYISKNEYSNLDRLLKQYRFDSLGTLLAKLLDLPLAPELERAFSNIEIKIEPLDNNTQPSSLYKVSNDGRALVIDREQLLKHVYWDLIRFQDSSGPLSRMACSLLVLVGIGLLLFVIVQGLCEVISG